MTSSLRFCKLRLIWVPVFLAATECHKLRIDTLLNELGAGVLALVVYNFVDVQFAFQIVLVGDSLVSLLDKVIFFLMVTWLLAILVILIIIHLPVQPRELLK